DLDQPPMGCVDEVRNVVTNQIAVVDEAELLEQGGGTVVHAGRGRAIALGANSEVLVVDVELLFQNPPLGRLVEQVGRLVQVAVRAELVAGRLDALDNLRSEEHTSELQSRG